MKTKSYLWLIAILWQCTAISADNLRLIAPEDILPASNIPPPVDLQFDVADAKNYLLEQKAVINVLKRQLEDSKTAQLNLQQRAGSITSFGLTIDKSLYVKVTTIAIWVLLVCLMILFFRARLSVASAGRARMALADVEQEYDEHIKKALEREQKLRRQLQDEINRHKISDAS